MVRIEHHICFWDKVSYKKAIKEAQKKIYKDKSIFGFLLGVSTSLIRYIPDFQTYAMLTKAGLIQTKKVEFSNWEEFSKAIEDFKIDDFPKGIWGKIIILVK